MKDFFSDQKLIVKMMGGFIITAIITMAVGLWGVSAVQTESGTIERIYTRHVDQVSDLKEAQILLLKAVSGQKNALVAYTPEQRSAFLKEVETSRVKFQEILAKLKRASSGQNNGIPADISTNWIEFEKANQEVIDRLKADQVEQAFQISNGAASETFTNMQAALQRTVDQRKAESSAEYNDSISRNQQARIVLLGLSLVGVFVGLMIGYYMARAVATPITLVVAGLQALERGDLTRTIGIYSKDEVGTLARTYDGLSAKLREVMQDVQDASNRVESAVALVSSSSGGNAQAHHRSGTATIEETAVAMRQILETSQRNAAVATDAAQRFILAKSDANQGRQAMEQKSQLA